jgi:putative peptidoglycan lipid II flippase
MRSDQSLASHILRSTALVMGLFGADKVLALVRDIMIGRAFGTSAALDAYYAAFELPDGLFTVLAGAAMSTTLIPVLTDYLQRNDHEGAWQTVSSVINGVLLIVIGVSALATLLAPQIIRVVAPGFGPDQVELAARMMRLVLIQTIISSVSGIVMGVLQAHQHFLLPAAAPICYNLGRILGAWLLAPHWGIFGLVWGGLAGTLAHLLIQIPGLIRFRARWWPVLIHPGLLRVGTLMVPRALTLGITYLNFVLPTYLGSRLAPGSISAYEYAWRLMQFPETVFATAVAIVVFPTLAERASIGDREGLWRTAMWALQLILTVTIPAGVGMVLLGRPLTALILQRGAFGPASTEAVYWALQFFSLGLVGHAMLEIATRLFYAQKDMWSPLWVTLITTTVNGVLGWILLPHLAHGGIALSNSVAACLGAGILLWMARRRLGARTRSGLMGTLIRTGLASALMAGGVLIFLRLLPDAGIFVTSVGGLTVGAVTYGLARFVAGGREIRELRMLLPPARRTEPWGDGDEAPFVVK